MVGVSTTGEHTAGGGALLTTTARLMSVLLVSSLCPGLLCVPAAWHSSAQEGQRSAAITAQRPAEPQLTPRARRKLTLQPKEKATWCLRQTLLVSELCSHRLRQLREGTTEASAAGWSRRAAWAPGRESVA